MKTNQYKEIGNSDSRRLRAAITAWMVDSEPFAGVILQNKKKSKIPRLLHRTYLASCCLWGRPSSWAGSGATDHNLRACDWCKAAPSEQSPSLSAGLACRSALVSRTASRSRSCQARSEMRINSIPEQNFLRRRVNTHLTTSLALKLVCDR